MFKKIHKHCDSGSYVQLHIMLGYIIIIYSEHNYSLSGIAHNTVSNSG